MCVANETVSRGRNVVFDGFPMYPDDVNVLLERGIFPDLVLCTNVDSGKRQKAFVANAEGPLAAG